MRIIHDLVQGSDEWKAHRVNYFNASDAAAAQGRSTYKSRTELIKERALGSVKEVDSHTQARFDRGHEVEALARPIAEGIIGEDLFNVTLSDTIDGLNLSASLDGQTMDEQITWEHKLLNANLRESLAAGVIPDQYLPQLEQGLLVSGAMKCLFMASDGTKDNTFVAWYSSRPEERTKLIAGWKQFAEDVKNYVHVEAAPVATAAPIKQLPALVVKLVGEVTSSNLAHYRATALEFIGNINTALTTDQDFADADNTVKFCEKAEQELDSVKAQALSQTATIDELFRTVDELKGALKAKRLDLTKLVAARKESIRAAILVGGKTDLAAHVHSLNLRIGKLLMPSISANFAEVMKNKRTVASLQNAVDTELARVKIEANQIADLITVNLRTISEAGHEHLFVDLPLLVLKRPEDLAATVQVRIAAEEMRRVEAERAKLAARPEVQVATDAELVAKQAASIQPAIQTESPSQSAVITAIRTGAAKRPTARELIDVVAQYWRVPTLQAQQWLDTTSFAEVVHDAA